MHYPCTVRRLVDGKWLAKSLGSEVGNVEVTAQSRDEALDLLRSEIRYRLEWCPCSAVADDYVQLVVRDEPPVAWRGTIF